MGRRSAASCAGVTYTLRGNKQDGGRPGKEDETTQLRERGPILFGQRAILGDGKVPKEDVVGSRDSNKVWSFGLD